MDKLQTIRNSYDVWCLEMMDDLNWKTSKCNCLAFLKDYICKDMVGMAIRLKICKPPVAAKAKRALLVPV
ncbi:unnamed protein product, partial [Adineta steineri]